VRLVALTAESTRLRQLPAGYTEWVATKRQTPPTGGDAGDSAEFETLIADLSSGFINMTPDQVDGAIEDALRRVCELLDIDLSLLWQWSNAAPSVLTVTHIYYAPGIRPSPDARQQEHYPYFVKQLLSGRVVGFASSEELPAEAAVDLEHIRRLGIKSNLTLPLEAGAELPLGVLGFNTLRRHRDWPDALVTRLRLVAQVLAGALARRRADEALRQSEERLSLAADAAEAGLWTLDYGSGACWATDRARAIYGLARDEAITTERLMAATHPDDRNLVRRAIKRSALGDELINLDYRIVPAEGEVRWVASRARPRFTPAGEPDRLMGVSLDITERKLADEALSVSEARLAAATELAGLAFYEVDFAAGTSYFDERYRDLCGVPPDREQGLQPVEFWIEHLHPDDRPGVMEARGQLYGDGGLERLSLEYRFLHPTRGEKWIRHVACVAMRDACGRATRSFGVLGDVTERKRTEAELRDLSRRLIRAHEEERALLARELHDDVSQRLAVLAIELGKAELAAPQDEQADAARAIREGLGRLSDDIHSLAYQLHPSILEELGLADALRAEGERCGRQGLHVWVHADPPPAAMNDDAALCLFRVAQEALSNVLHHAAASVATVRLRVADGGLLLAVSDNGVGFDRKSSKGASLGLLSMRERVRVVDGDLDIESAPGAGSTIVAWVPTKVRPR